VIAQRQSRVQVWASSFAANDFPPVCAMTGRPAETWRKFRFITAPGWAYAFLALTCLGIGLLLIFIVMRLVSRSASGYLPLTRASSDLLRNTNWLFGGSLLFGPALWIAGVSLNSGSSEQSGASLGVIVVLIGLLVFAAAVTAWLVVRPLVGPRGKVMAQQPGHYDRIVEISNVHPAFVSAVQQHQQMRTQQAYRQ
jgi:hypothetical protein